MTVKVYKLDFTASASSTWTRKAQLITPAGYIRKLMEIRLYFSATSGTTIRVYHETEYVAELSAEVWNTYKLPIPADVEVPAGTGLYIEAENSNASDVDIIVELVVDERAV